MLRLLKCLAVFAIFMPAAAHAQYTVTTTAGYTWSFTNPNAATMATMSAGYIYTDVTISFNSLAAITAIGTPSISYGSPAVAATVSPGSPAPTTTSTSTTFRLVGNYNASAPAGQPPIAGSAGTITYTANTSAGPADTVTISVTKFVP